MCVCVCVCVCVCFPNTNGGIALTEFVSIASTNEPSEGSWTIPWTTPWAIPWTTLRSFIGVLVVCSMLVVAFGSGFMEADGLFALEGIHVAGAEQSMVEIREALEYYCINFLRPWLEEYFYQKVLTITSLST